MASLKIGTDVPSAIMFDKPITKTKEALFDYYKFANDGGGYFVRGLWLAPVSPWGPYTWPWDLGVPSGALKDINDGFRYWGYVLDGCRKNITQDMVKNFAENVKGNYHVAITIYYNTPNYTDDEGNTYLDLGDHPIVITFYDDRFDDYNWVLSTGAIAEWSEDKRTVTIYRIPSSRVVYQSNNSDKTIDKVREDLYNVYVDVKGLTYNYSDITEGDPSSIECWSIKKGDEEIYNKDRTYENYLEKYGFINESTSSYYHNPNIEFKVRDIINPDSSLNSVIAHPIVDLDDNMIDLSDYYNPSFLRWRIKPDNMDYWDHVKEWFANNSITNTHAMTRMFENSNLDEITLNIKPKSTNFDHIDLSDMLFGSQVKKVTINLSDNVYVNSSLNVFKHADYLKEIVCPHTFSGRMATGMFEFCNALETYPSNLIDWSARLNDNYNPLPTNKVSYFAEYSYLKNIPSFTEDRFSDANTIIVGDGVQTFNGCSCQTIGPVIDCRYVDPQEASLMFNCWKLKDARIKYLNHGNWNLDDSGTVINGNLVSLNKESVDYLFDNLMDLNIHDDAKQVSPTTTFLCNLWNISSGNYAGLSHFVLKMNESGLGLGTSLPFKNLQVRVSGMGQKGDVLLFGELASILEDGIYTFDKEDDSPIAFTLSRLDLSLHSEVTVEMLNRYDPANPKVSSANLYLPENWGKEIIEGVSLFSKMTKENDTVVDGTHRICATTRLPKNPTTSTIWGSVKVTNLKIKIEGLQEGDTLGVGAGNYDAIAHKYTKDGIYTVGSFNSNWAIKLFNDNTSITSKVIVTFLGCDEYPVTITEPRVTADMVETAKNKGWTVFIGGNPFNS